MLQRDQELLDMLAEESAEVIQAIMKINRHGIESYHPDFPEKDNRQLLKDEMTDLLAVIEQVEKYIVGDIMFKETKQAWNKKLKYSHHQGQPK